MTLNASPIGAPVDTPLALTPEVPLNQITDVPVTGSGLAGEVYAPGDRIRKLEHLEEIIQSQGPDGTFTATQVAYGGNGSQTTVAEFLGDDAASLSGGGNLEMGPSGLKLTGFIYIPEGVHEIGITSDDGFAMTLGGVAYMAFEGTRGADETARAAEFDGGLYAIELLYFDAFGKQSLGFEIDGLPVLPSALYQSPADLLTPPAGTVTVPVAEYHPSQFLEQALDDPTTEIGTDQRDVIYAFGGDDTVDALAGDDDVFGGYGDDALFGGDGDDFLDGGRGSDYLRGGDGNDLLLARADAGEQRIGQLAVGKPTRDDPDGEVNPDRQKLYGWESMPLVSDDILEGGNGRDTFLIQPLLNGKLDIIQKHVRSDGTINWAGVAGENNELHDHWADAGGFEVIADFKAADDTVAVIGHTANVSVGYDDVDGDGDDESIITILSQQHGGGGAHTQDLLGIVIVHGDRVEEEMIQTDAGVTYGIVETYAEVAEALFPEGDLKVTDIGGETVYGYDTREPGGELGPVTGNPEDHIENPYTALVTYADPTTGTAYEQTRDPFDQLGVVEVPGLDETGTNGADSWSPEQPEAPGTPAPLSHWQFSGDEGAFADARGGETARAYTLYENQARLRTDGVVEGPDGALTALSFNGEDQFAYIPHDPAFQVTQGTISLWVNPADLTDEGMFVSKDQRNSGDGGHFRLGHTDDGGLLLRMAPGDGGGNKSWETGPLLAEGQWQHLAVSFTQDGVLVYADGVLVGPGKWTAVEGDVASPNVYTEAFFLNNKEPWVLGADQRLTRLNETAQQFGVDDEDLDNPFHGALADFALFGGYELTDALTDAEVSQLATPGFDIGSLTGPSGPQPMLAGDDIYDGLGGDDSIDGGAGNDSLAGSAGNDSINGGYGDDILDGGEGNDTLDGGRGSDLVIGGLGDDVLRARSDAGEDRAGQLVLDDPSRPYPDAQIDPQYLKLADWLDQALVADDILVGGAGNDHFQIETLINGTRESITDNLMDGGRTIRWHGVAGENARIHNHWVDSIGIDVIADYNAQEDIISIIGHTTQVEVEHKAHDSTGDGLFDSAVSVITLYSQQGNGGGAHDEDYLGYVVVHGDLVDEDDIITDAGAHYGIVDTVDQLQEALAPTGTTKTRDWNGQELFGYDSRDVVGDPIGSDPEAFAENPYADLVDYADTSLNDLPALGLVLEEAGGSFDGATYATIAHDPGMQQETGTIAFSFTAEAPGGRDQALISKDHSGHLNGGHMTAWVDSGGYLKVRFQDDSNISRQLKFRDEKIAAGEAYNVAFSFDNDTLSLFVNGEMVDAEDGFPGGMLGNTEEILVGASARRRQGVDDRAEWIFNGTISNILMFDRSLTEIEAVLLDEADGDFSALRSTLVPDTTDEPGDPGPTGALNEIVGTDRNDKIGGTVEGDHILGLNGNDELHGRLGNDLMEGGQGQDRMRGGAGIDEMHGGLGDDVYYVDDTDIVVEKAGQGRDLVISKVSHTLAANVEDLALRKHAGDIDGTGNGSDNLITGSFGDNVLSGDDGNDRIRGRQGDDTAFGGDGEDWVFGDQGEDELSGDGDNDRLFGGDDNDVLFGGEGDDFVFGGAGADEMSGGVGNDVYRIDNLGDMVVEALGEGIDRVAASITWTLGENVENLKLRSDAGDLDGTGNILDNRIVGSDGANALSGADGNDTLRGKAGSDSLFGGDDDDRLFGHAGNDSLFGGDGEDRLYGHAGNDLLAGGDGLDILWGDVGLDRFLFESAGDTTADRVLGFETGTDVVVLGGQLGADLAGVDLIAAFAEEPEATDADDRLVYDQQRGHLSYDADGAGGLDAQLIAWFGRGQALSVDDIELL